MFPLLCLWGIVVDPNFICGQKSAQTISLVALKTGQTLLGHFHSGSMSRAAAPILRIIFSFPILQLKCDIYSFRWHPYSFSNLTHFSQRSTMAILCTFAIVARFGRPLRGSSSELSWPNSDSLVHLATVEYEGAEFPVCSQSCFHIFLYEVLNQCSNLIFFHFRNLVRGNNNKESSLPLSCSKSIDTARVHSQRIRDFCAGISLR